MTPVPIIPQTPEQAAQRDHLAGLATPPELDLLAEHHDLLLAQHSTGVVLHRGNHAIALSADDLQWLFDDGIHAALEAAR